ncbi:Uu.00g078700.m01.CDS01 [Anthostomella pinea]|uniref:Uu.00g078700.m01.CDS01 n=1 Tax=Anthostomella pinea TaxID=933095 RepID=A0AAI8VKL7_9PEZI|nr:Uu.00g078700.m01.CDS01 [Anthostomella pinea]
MDMYQSAIYNAKVAVTFDAITQNNKFGSNRWIWADCGVIIVKEEKAAPGTAWGEVLSHFFDDDKFERSIRLTGDSGLVLQEYGSNMKRKTLISDISVQTFDNMDANGFYDGREEVVIGYLPLRYPNTVFSIPYYESNTPLQLGFPGRSYPARTAWSAYGGRATAPPINDPMSTVYCPGGMYQPRQPNLKLGEW